MKANALFVLILLSLCINCSYATVRTVSNNISGGSQYPDLQSAYFAAQNGDTLLVEGTGMVYNLGNSNIAIAKSLTIIGEGFNTEKQSFKRTMFNGFSSSDFRITQGANNSKFYGIYFTANVTLQVTLSNITFEDCLFGSTLNIIDVDANNITVRNCVFDGNNIEAIKWGGAQVSLTMTGCIVDGYINGQNGANADFTANHCIFLQNSSTISTLTDVKNAIITNCIFMNSQLTFNTGTTNCTFMNNMERLTSTLPANGGNIGNTNPMFTTYSLNTFYQTSYDWHLLPGSAAHNAGTEGTDLGVHGGTSNFNETGEVLITPVVRAMEIFNTTVAPNGTLNVHVKSTKPHNQ